MNKESINGLSQSRNKQSEHMKPELSSDYALTDYIVFIRARDIFTAIISH